MNAPRLDRLTLLLLFSLASAACEPPPDDEAPCDPASGRICRYAGTGTAGLSPDGIDPLDTELYLPQDMTLGPEGNLYVVDWNNHRIRVIDDGVVRTIIGTGQLGDAPEGPALETSLNHPTHVAFEGDGNLILSAWHNSKVLRYSPLLGTVARICGTGARDINKDADGKPIDGKPGVETLLDLPAASAPMKDGSILISDQANQRIIKLGADEIVTSVAGTPKAPGYEGDEGPATAAKINLPVSQSAPPAGRIALGPDEAIYLADTLNHAVRKVAPDGTITTIAGTGTAGNGAGSDATAAALHAPSDVAVDQDGNVYIADTMNHCVRKVTPAGVLSTAAGRCGTPGDSGNGGPATEALLDRPYGVEVAADGTLYVADTHNHVLRVVWP